MEAPEWKTTGYQGVVAGFIVLAILIVGVYIMAGIALDQSIGHSSTIASAATNQTLTNAFGSAPFPDSKEDVVLFDTPTQLTNMTYAAGVFTVKKSGNFNFSFNAIVTQPSGTSGTVLAWIRKNGVNGPYYGLSNATLASDDNYYVTVNTGINLASGDTFQVIVAHSSNASAIVDSYLANTVAPASLQVNLV